MPEKILEFQNIVKAFGGIKALSDVSLDIERGEIHAIVGENGAGKSTLIKTCAGAYVPDSGKIIINGKTFDRLTPALSEENGIGVIYQEFNLVNELTVAENVFLGHPIRKGILIDFDAMNRRAAEIFEQLHVSIDPKALVKDLSVGYQQIVEIAKAVSMNAKVLIMDEPSAPLTNAEVDKMFELVHVLRDSGVTIIYISHRLEEIFALSDRVTILRDGQKIKTLRTCDTNQDELIQLMVGRELKNTFPPRTPAFTDEVILELRDLCGNGLEDISLRVHKGEILGLAGLVGAGRTELAHAILGIDKIDSGEVSVYGKRIPRLTPHRCIQSGIGLLPESRKENGLTLILPIFQNITAAALEKISSGGVLGLRKEKKIAEDYIQKLSVACPGAYQLPLYLSGGNQQKVVLGKWLFTESKVLIFDEPTRGIDIGARDEIYRMIDDLAKSGVSILIISSDLPEIMTIADRVCVMREGRIVADLDIADASQEIIASYAAGGKHE